MSKTLYVTDLDGTFLTPESRVSDLSAAMVSRLSREGAMITVATARTPATVEPLLARTLTVPPAVVMTGATLWDRGAKEYIDSKFIRPEDVVEIGRRAARHGINPFIYTLPVDDVMQVYHSGPMSAQDEKFVRERQALSLKFFNLDRPCEECLHHSRTILFFAMGPIESVNALADDLRANVDCSVSNYVDIFGKDVGIIEIFAPGISKAAAVGKLARDCAADRVVVFGDNLNDLSMMEIADVSVAVGNALPEVKRRADVVIGRNDEDAVARFIEEDFNSHR